MVGNGRRLTLLLVLFSLTIFAYAKYKILDIQVKPAAEYSAHQNFQEVVIGAYPYDTLTKVKEIFDTDKLTKKGFLPVLLVIENNNSFPIQVFEEEVYLVEKSGIRQRALRYIDVLIAAHLKDPLSESSGNKQLQLDKLVKKEMLLDFEHKSFGEKLIAPFGSDHGVVFFRLPDEGHKNSYLYFPEIINLSKGEALMFFEFPLN